MLDSTTWNDIKALQCQSSAEKNLSNPFYFIDRFSLRLILIIMKMSVHAIFGNCSQLAAERHEQTSEKNIPSAYCTGLM